MTGDVRGDERGATVQANPGAAPPAVVCGYGYLDRPREGTKETPVDGRASMTEHRPVAAGEDRGHPAPLNAQPRVPDRVDAAMEAVKLPTAHPHGDGVLPQTGADQLGVGGDAMLPRRDLGDGGIGWGAFFGHVPE